MKKRARILARFSKNQHYFTRVIERYTGILGKDNLCSVSVAQPVEITNRND